MPCYAHQPFQPDIFTYDVVTSANRHLTLLTIPREIRDEIFSIVVEGEQENTREYVGTHRNTERSDYCTPLSKIRPPALPRVCRQTREEYLPIYFQQTCFRVYIDIGKALNVRPDISPEPQPLDTHRVHFDAPAQAWLKSISYLTNKIFLRNLQFRLTERGGVAVGASFNVAYNARSSRYEAHFVLDDGFNTGFMPEWTSHVRTAARVMPKHAWSYVVCCSAARRGEWLGLDDVMALAGLLNPANNSVHPFQTFRSDNIELGEWFEETGGFEFDPGRHELVRHERNGVVRKYCAPHPYEFECETRIGLASCCWTHESLGHWRLGFI